MRRAGTAKLQNVTFLLDATNCTLPATATLSLLAFAALAGRRRRK